MLILTWCHDVRYVITHDVICSCRRSKILLLPRDLSWDLVKMTTQCLGGQYGHREERHPRPPEALLHRGEDGHRDWTDYGVSWTTLIVVMEDDLDCLCCRMSPGRPTTSGPLSGRLVHSHWSRNVEARLSLVESFPSDAGASSLMP